MSKQETLSFEQALERLEEVVAKLERGDVPLEEAINLYQEGMQLSQQCNGKLKQVEAKIEMLIDSDQGITAVPFAPHTTDKGE